MAEIPDFISSGPVGGNFDKNLYYEPDTAYGVPGLIITPGLYMTLDVGTGPIRGMLVHKNVLYIVASNYLYCWIGSGGITTLSSNTFDTSTGATGISSVVSMAVNASDEIVMTDHQTAKLYTWTITNTATGAGTWSEPATVGSIVPAFLTYQDTFFIMGDKASRAIYCSGVDDATTWSALNVSTKMGAPDLLSSGISTGGVLWIFGTHSAEPWYYTGSASGLPFSRVGQGHLGVGCIAPRSVCQIGNSVYWLNHLGQVCRTVGYDFEVVSPPQLNDEIQRYAQSGAAYVSEAIGFLVSWEGHQWYMLHFPTYSTTWVFDLLAASIGQKGWFQMTTGSSSRHPSNCSAYFLGKWYVGDSESTGYLYELKDEYYSDYLSSRYATKYTKYIADPGHRVIFDEFSLRAEHTSYYTSARIASTYLTADAAEGATTITVNSATGMASGQAIRIRLNTGSYHTTSINGAPSGTTITLLVAMPSARTSGATAYVYTYDYYGMNPYVSLAVTGASTKTKTTLTSPIKFHSLGSGYETLITITYRGCGRLTLLGAGMRARVATR